MENNKPQFRFNGFDEDWVKSDFDNVFSAISNNSLSREKLNYQSGNAKNIHYGDVLVKFNEIVDVEKEVIPFISDNEIVEKLKNSRLLDGDIIISDAAEDEMVGKCVEIINIKNNIVFSGLHTIAVRPKQKFAPRYLGFYMNSDSYHNQLLKLMQGTKVLSISKTAIKKTFINHPKNENEQLQISNFFENLDKLLTEHQQKHSKLKELKKAMLAKMFPQQGQTVPEIRFKGFIGDWEEKKLSKIAKTTTGNSNRIDSGIDGDFAFFDRSDDVRRSNIYLFDCEAIIVAGEGSDFIPKYFKGKFDLHQRTYAIMDFKEVKGSYLFYYIHYTRKHFIDNAVGSTVKSLRLPIFENMLIKFPSKDEQKLIGNYFKNLDNLIANHELQISKLQNIKKAFLAKMFI